ncbi:MAG TPA: winged helix-turn-helix domain-containing protein [Vicinamibacterales bacterium]
MKVRFHSFVLDTGPRELLQEAGSQGSRQQLARPVHLSPKAFDILQILVERRPNVVSKETLMTEVWPDKLVEEANLAIAVGEIRKALGDDSKAPAIVVTVPRRGYRFAAEVVDLDPRASADGDTYLRWWLTWKEKTLPLREGENLVGRHPASAVWINATSVSRTHARIVVSGGTAVIEDCGSRNGTLVEGRKITGRHTLVDGDTVVLGSETVVFRQWSDEGAAGTEPVRR